MTDRELMQQALEALENFDRFRRIMTDGPDVSDKLLAEDYAEAGFLQGAKTIPALRDRLAQPEMQPCAGRNCGSTNPNLHSAECFEDYEKSTGMNQRKPLTDEVIWLEYQRFWPFHPAEEPKLAKDIVKFARAIEAKLKEKNNG